MNNNQIFYSILIRCTNSNRQEWSNAIEKHHPFNTSSYFNVCIRHFKQTDYTIKKDNLYKLNPNVIPTVFDITNPSENADTSDASNVDCSEHLIICDDGTEVVISTISENEDISSNSNDVFVNINEIIENDEDSSNASKSQINQLKTELINLKLAHDIEIQRFKKKIQIMEDQSEEKSMKLQQTMNQLARETTKNVRLEALNTELRTSHIQSKNGTTNVSVKFCILL